MKVGLIAFSSDTGLGYQTLDFARHIKCEKILIVDLSKINGMAVHHERFRGLTENLKISDGVQSDRDCEWLTDGIDLLFVCETPLNHNLFEIARQKGVKSILQYNYEFLHHVNRKLPIPDVLAAPSYWMIDEVDKLDIAKTIYLPVPIDRQKITLREYKGEKPVIFTHIAGRPAAHDRNGSVVFLEACMMLNGDYHYEIYLQAPKDRQSEINFHEIKRTLDVAKSKLKDNLIVHFDTPNLADMYKNGHILVLPRKYGGLCLPMWEALSAGMPVIMPNISPNNKILPSEWLVQAHESGHLETHSKIQMYRVEAYNLADKMRSMAKNLEKDNVIANIIAELGSWEKRKKNYIKLFKELCK